MKRSRDRILVTHAGSLPRPPDLWEMLTAKANGQSYDRAIFADCLRRSVAAVVRKQVDSGIDVVNDGEFGKHSFSDYAQERLGGWVERPVDPAERPPAIFGRDLADFPEYFAAKGGRAVVGRHASRIFCSAPLTYVGQTALKTDIDNFKAALAGARVEEAFLPAVAPGTIEHRIKNDYYASDEEYLHAVAEAMHVEYKAIVDAGFILQIDDPDLADGWQLNAHLTLAEYRKFAALRIDALNHALTGIPEDRVRFHMCWGSYHGPHKYDIPLRDIVDLILRVRAEVYSIEASNPCHEHEWRVWEEIKLPEGKALIPGVTGHYSDFIEHPEAIADRLVKYARLVGRENVMAGTDCGLGTRVGHPKITWAKFEAMREGARLASRRLWGD